MSAGVVNNGFESEKAEAGGTVISCHGVSYNVDVRGPGCCAKSVDKQILFDIDAVFKPGLNAIMGATGSGKTSLLDCLAGRKDPSGLSGKILVNGKKQPKNFKHIAGYVVQDDIVLGTLTVRENIMFSANMRLGSDISREEKDRRVDDTISDLGLSHVAHHKVGNQFIRGVSGGERKRTNIGMELAVSPTLLFLDEPTSGLDANTAGAVLRLLSNVSKNNRTIIFSIHQPRYSIYKLFTNLVLLAKGLVVYQGQTDHALGYFGDLGYVCEAHNNPPDFFLDIINADPEVVGSNRELTNGAAKTKQDDAQIEMHIEDEKQNFDEIAKHLSGQYQKSSHKLRVAEQLSPIFANYESKSSSDIDLNGATAEYATSFATQFKYLAKRTVTNIVRNPAVTVLQVLVMIVLAVIAGVLFFDQDDKLEEALQNRNGLFFFTIMNLVFSNMGAIELFIKERVVFTHESSNGFYRTSSYFFSKIVFDFIPLRVIPVVFHTCILYYMVGLSDDVGSFFFFLLSLILISVCAASVSFAAGAGIEIYSIANIAIALSYILMMIFGGLFVSIESIWVGVRWLQYLSLFRYGFNAMMINEYKGLEFRAFNETSKKYDIITLAGEEYLKSQNIDFDTQWDAWKNLIALTCMTIGFLTIAYIQLRRIKRYK